MMHLEEDLRVGSKGILVPQLSNGCEAKSLWGFSVLMICLQCVYAHKKSQMKEEPALYPNQGDSVSLLLQHCNYKNEGGSQRINKQTSFWCSRLSNS